MKLTKFLISFLPILFISLLTYSQETDEEKASLDGGTVESQFEYLYQKSPKWTDPRTGQQYRTIKVNDLFKFRNNVYDSLSLGRKIYNESQAVVNSQKNRIDSLNVQLASINNNLDAVTKEKDSISLFGIQMSKGGYNALLWSIIVGLTAALLFFIAKFKNSNAITVEAKKAKTEIEEEYENHRQRALEREQKLRRELQDELNKQKYAKQAASKKPEK